MTKKELLERCLSDKDIPEDMIVFSEAVDVIDKELMVHTISCSDGDLEIFEDDFSFEVTDDEGLVYGSADSMEDAICMMEYGPVNVDYT
jgi:hypothetical protein